MSLRFSSRRLDLLALLLLGSLSKFRPHFFATKKQFFRLTYLFLTVLSKPLLFGDFRARRFLGSPCLIDKVLAQEGPN